MKIIRALACLLLLYANAAQAGINNPGSGVPVWVLSLGPILPDIAINWQLNQVWTKSTGAITTPAAAGITITRASAETNLLYTSSAGFAFTSVGSGVIASGPAFGGLQVWETRTNFLLNSTAPATQTTGSLANGTYTLWVNGSGTATMSSGTATGCGTSAASQGTPISFTTSGTAGTCTVTVGGSLNFFQLELNPGSVSAPSPGIVTAGATVTRAGDVVSVPISGIGSAATVFEQGIAGTPTTYGTGQFQLEITDGSENNRIAIGRSSGTGTALYRVTAATVAQFSSNSAGVINNGATYYNALSVIAGTQNQSLNGVLGTPGSGASFPSGLNNVNFGLQASLSLQWLDGVDVIDAIWLTQAIPTSQLVSLR